MSHMDYILRASQQQAILGYMNIQGFSTTFSSTYRIWSDFLQDGLWNSGLPLLWNRVTDLQPSTASSAVLCRICAVQLGDTAWTTHPSALAAWNEPPLLACFSHKEPWWGKQVPVL